MPMARLATLFGNCDYHLVNVSRLPRSRVRGGLVALALATLLLTFAGCGDMSLVNSASLANVHERSAGSPFRWKVVDLPGTGAAMVRVLLTLPKGATRADAVLQRDILAKIGEIEKNRPKGVVPAGEFEEVRLTADGREIWIFSDEGNPRFGIAFVVQMIPSPAGGTDVRISDPNRYFRQQM